MPSLSDAALRQLTDRLRHAQDAFAAHYPGESGTRQPVHTVYGGAHLFKFDTTRKLGDLALKALEQYAPEPRVFAEALGLPGGVADTVHPRVRKKLEREPVEDLASGPMRKRTGTHARPARSAQRVFRKARFRPSSASASRRSPRSWAAARYGRLTCS